VLNEALHYEYLQGSGGITPSYLTSPLDGASHPGRFTCRETIPGTHLTGGLVGPRVELDVMKKRKS
jgi:hypothetical protein